MELYHGGILGKIMGVVRRISGLRVSVYASYACYFIILSLFPSLILLLGLLRYTGLSVDTLTGAMGGILPEALLPAAKKFIVSTYRNTTGMVISLSALAALWSSGRGVYGLLAGLNAVYGVKESRGYLRTRAISVGYTFLLLLVLILTLVLQVFGSFLLHRYFRFWLLLALQTGVFAAMFTVLPNRKSPFREALPGAMLASLGWLVFSGLFSLYVERVSGYASIYGSIYAVPLSMLWLYCCISILLYGGALNHHLVSRKK